MTRVAWRGPAPPPVVQRALAGAQFQIRRDADDAVTDVGVICTSTPRPPAGRPGARQWIWVSRKSVVLPIAVEAVARGAYAVVSLDAPDAAATLVTRLRELLVSEPAPATPAHIVAESAATRAVVAQVARVAPTSMPVLITG